MHADWSRTGYDLLRIVIAYALAVPIGLDWERIRHSVGLRTFPLVAVASCAYVLVAQHMAGSSTANLDRVIQGLMTGIGFIGGGAIFKQGAMVHGAATAASIWVVGALGAAVAFGSYDIAIVLAVVNWATVRFMKPIKEALGNDERD